MKRHGLILLILCSFTLVTGMDHIQELRDKVTGLQGELKSKYVYTWFGLSIALVVASKYMMDHSVALEKELKEKWLWNPVTEQEELPEGIDQNAINIWYWSSTVAAGISPFPLIGGMVQWLNTIIIRDKIRLLEKSIELEEAAFERRQYFEQQYEAQSPDFRRWRQTHPRGTYADYLLEMLSGMGARPEPQLRSYYEILGVAQTASAAQIKKAYYALSREYSPNTNSSARDLDDAERARREAVYKDISDAWHTLKDPELKTVYDDSWPYTTEEIRRRKVQIRFQQQGEKRQEEAEKEAERKRRL